MQEERRDFFKAAALAAAGAGLAAAGRPSQAATETARENRFARRFEIIDFRCRPPIAQQKLLFDMKLGRLKWKNKFNVIPAQATSPSMYEVGTEKGLRLLRQEMDEAGVDRIVVPGRKLERLPEAVRNLSGIESINVGDELLLDLSKKFGGRAIGLHGIDVADPKRAADEIERAVKDLGLPGVVLEVGYTTLPDGSPIKLDDKRLFPIYEAVTALDAVLMLQSGIYAGFDIGANDWPPLDRVLQRFPEMKVILAHGGYPRVLDALALVSKHPNLYISPDIYCFFPGGRLYVESIPLMPDQFVFGTAYPFAPLKESVELVLQFPLPEDVMAKYLGGNAARLLGL